MSNQSGAWYNYAGSYEVLGSINTGTIKVNGGDATFSGNISATTAMEIATGASATISGNATTVGLTNNGALVVQNGGTLSINSTITNAGSLTIAEGAKLQINSLSGYNCTKGDDYTLSGTDGTYGYQEGRILTYDLVTGAGSITLNGSVMLDETDITSSVTNGQYSAAQTEKVYEITGDYTGPVIEYNGASGETSEADSFIVHEGASLKITNTANSNGALGKNVSGEGTLIIAAAANDTISFTRSSMADFTGTVDVISGAVYLGNVASEKSGAAADFAASKIIVRDGAAFWTHMSAETLGADIDLLSGATLGNKDIDNDYQGNIRFNIVDPDAETASYNKDGVVTINQYWHKNVKFSGLLEGDGIVQMKAANVEANANYELSNASNTFAGTYKVIDGDNANNSGKTTTLKLSSATAAQYATIDLASTGAVSVLKLAGNSTIAALYGSDADNYVTTDATGTLTVSEGSFGGKMQNGNNATLSLTKTGSGTLTLSGTIGASEAALGSITVNGGNLEILNTSYVTSVNMTGGNLTYGGTDVTHTISEGVTSSDGSGNSTFAVASGSTVNVGSFDNAWGASMVIDGSLVASGAISFASNSAETISGTGSISASSLAVTNHSEYQVSTQQLTIGKDGLTLGNPEGSWGSEKGILSLAGETATINGATNIKTSDSVLNLNAGSTTIAGAVTNSGSINVKGGSATLNGGISGSGTVALSGGSLALGSGEGITNEIAQFNYSGGTLTHSGLTVTNATFSGATLDNTTNGTLTLTGTLNVTNIVGLTKGEGSYSGGAVEGNGYYTGSLTVITGNDNLSYGDSFEVQLNGTALTDDSTNTSYYTKSENGTLTLNVTDTSTFIVNTGTETTEQAGSTASSFFVAEGATLVLSDDLENSKTLSLSGTGKLSVVIGTNTDVSHANNLTASDFNGVVEISKKEGGLGNTNLTKYNLGADASFRLISGNHWSNDNTVFARDIELAGQSVNDFRFAHTGNLTLSGKVTGTYLSAGSVYDVENFKAGNYENGNANNLILSGEGSDIKYVNMANGTLTVNADMAFGTVNAPTLNIGTGSTLTIGLADTSTTSEIGTLSAAQGALNLKENTLITLGAGAANAQKVHSLGGISTGTGAGLVLGDYATLQINDIPSALKDDYGTGGNTDSASSLQLAIGGGTGSVLELALSARATDNTDWKRNNTVTLSTPTGAAGGVGEVHVSSGSLANAVFSGSATTNLNGAALRMADGTSIILRKANSSENLGAGDITLEGTTELFNYNITGTLTNNISGNKLNITNEGNVTLTGNVNLQALQMGINTTLGDGVNERTYTLGAVTATSPTTLTVSKNATLNHLSSVTGTVTLAGSGVYDLGSGTSANVSGLTEATWTGTVKKHSNGDIVQLNTYANANSTLDLSGVKAWISNNQTFNGTLQLTNNGDTSALSLNDGYSTTAKATFAGTIKGTGDISYIWNGGTEGITAEHTFSAATDEWGGKFVAKSTNKNVSLSFTKAGNVFDGDSERAGVENASAYKLTVNVGSSAENGDITFDGTIGKTGNGAVELNVTNNKVTFNKTVNVDKLTVAQGASAQLGNTMTVGGVSFSASESATAESPAKLLANGSSALAQLQEDASFTIQDMTLSNVKLSAVEGASVALTNVSATNTLLAGGGDFTLNATPTVEAAANDTTTGRISYTCGLGVESGSSLTLNLDVINAVSPDQHGTYDLSITLSGFGSDFVIEDNAILGMVKFDASSWLAQALEEQGAEWRAEITASTENTVVTQSSVPTVTYSAGTGENVGMLVITINGLNVPEPASATLGLAALMMLCARRRRKA